MSKPINTALVGFGFSGQTFHGPFLSALEQFEVVSVLSSQPDKVKQKFPNATVSSSLEEVLATDVELVVITTPNTLHFEQAKKCIEAGKHIIVEKPFMITSKEAQEIADLAEKKGVLLSVYHNRRYSDDLLTLKSLIRDGKMGELISFEGHFDRFRPEVRDRWRERDLPGSGMLYDLGSHLVDQAVQLFGRPDKVYCDSIKQRNGAQSDDYFHMVLYFGNKRAILHSSVLVPKAPSMITAHGTGGSFYAFNIDPQEAQLIAGVIPTDDSFGTRTDKGEYTDKDGVTTPLSYEKGAMVNYFKEFANAVRNGGQVPVTPKDAVTVIKIIETAAESARRGAVIDYSD
ncbi:hypothetical protein AKO1_014594 [Acrasis kona]|uniref:Oxidoreductase n=1 Tax=Acrasis kona TaxID=1008807 RepID=A0AAW2Z0U9_9EUKA